MLKALISRKLKESRNHCEYKKAWTPKGWAVVKIRPFAAELAKEIEACLAKRESGDD